MKKLICLFNIFLVLVSQVAFSQFYKIEQVKDILPGSNGSSPQDLVKAGNYLFFTADDGVHGRELWKSDGTIAGTLLVKDIFPGINPGDPGDLITVLDNVFFRARDNMYGLELWRSQFSGVGAGTTTMVKDINPFGNSTPLHLTNTDGTLKFAANNGINGEELWHSDGSAIGTTMIADLASGAVGSFPNGLFGVNDFVYFRTNLNGGLYRAKSSYIDGPLEVAGYDDMDLGPLNFSSINSTLLFSGNGNNSFFDIGRELFYKEYGENEQIKLKKDINFGASNSNPSLLTTIGSNLYFIATDGSGIGLWKSSEFGEPEKLRSFSAGTTISRMVSVNNWLYFFIFSDGETQLWKSGGTLATTLKVKTLNDNILFQMPTDAIDFNGTLIFSILHPTNGKEIWQSNGSEVGTFVIKDLNSGPNSSEPNHFEVVNDMLFFTADDGVNGRELFKMYNCYGSQKNFSIKNGNWGDADTWNCGRVPVTTEQITIKGHTININGSFGVQKIFFEGGNITMPAGSALTFYPTLP